MGRRQRQRQRAKLSAPLDDPGVAQPSEYRDAEGNALVLRGSLPPAARREYTGVLTGGLDREDAERRAVELLFERLAVSWSIAGLEIDRQRELLGRYRMATAAERGFVRETLREHAGRHFPELEVP